MLGQPAAQPRRDLGPGGSGLGAPLLRLFPVIPGMRVLGIPLPGSEGLPGAVDLAQAIGALELA